MVNAWLMDDSDADQRLPHKREPNVPVSLDALRELGVLYWHLDPEAESSAAELARIREERGYSYTDTINVAPDTLPNYEAKIKMFFEEHMHSDEEIRYVLDGTGYFDVRDKEDRWVRIEVAKGDMITLPAGIYHRFTLDSRNYIKAMRLFVGEPVWTPINRPADDHPARHAYVTSFAGAAAAAAAVAAPVDA